VPTFQLNDKLFKGLLALTGAAIASVLQEYETGQFKRVEFSQKNSGSDLHSITSIIQDVQDNSIQRYEFLSSRLMSLITSLTDQV